MSEHPYKNLPNDAFWHKAVSSLNPTDITDVYQPKFPVKPNQKIATAGSCFAQHFSKALKARKYCFFDVEPAPDILPPSLRHSFNYGTYSARYGNIYSARQLLQTLQRSTGDHTPADEFWLRNGKFLDPQRPAIEPEGFASLQELSDSRNAHLMAVRKLFESARVFVFTLGLTEAWLNQTDGTVYPSCPGVIGGTFNASDHIFKNFTFREIFDDLDAFMKLARKLRPQMQFIFTVSPVPLTATASGQHVLAATMRSKSILRAVCAEICDTFDYADYFPSYELISAPPFKGFFFEPDMRAVSSAGVDFVMNAFFAAHQDHALSTEPIAQPEDRNPISDLQCEEEILKGFSK